MWESISTTHKEKYKKLICNFASMTKIFSQKSENEDYSITPIVNSKFQETVFQKAFHAKAEDISNTSFDASVIVDDQTKYAIGIKAFRFDSSEQKVAQFKKNSNLDGWNEIIYRINSNANGLINKHEVDEVNHTLYLELAKKISFIRNERILSSLSLIKGFENDSKVESIYHVLMPYNKKNSPKIFVGEIDYSLIEIEKISIIGCTNIKNPGNFRFTDGKHIYKYTYADSQLYMKFNNKDIIYETWDIEYLDDPFLIIDNINIKSEKNNIEQTVSWLIYDKNKIVPQSSGFNAFDGGPKHPIKDRKRIIKNFTNKYKNIVDNQKLSFIERELNDILLKKYNTTALKQIRKHKSTALVEYIQSINNKDIIKDVEKIIFRRFDEVYIPIYDSVKFHKEFPDFFGKEIGLLNHNDRLVKPKEERIFELYFVASDQSMKAYINQDGGKAIQSYGKQGILGQWLINDVFQLKNRERLDFSKLLDLNINGVRLIKYKNKENFIGIEFIWIDEDNPPSDAIGWVAKNKK